MESNEQIASEISTRIANLTTFEGENLKNEMAQLKIALRDNAAACMLLQPEDIGLAVAALRRIVGSAIVEASKTKTKTKEPKAVKMTPKELQDALDDM